MTIPYIAPVDEMLFTMESIACWRDGVNVPADLAEADIRAILQEAGKLVAERIAPLNRAGDLSPPILRDGKVTMPAGWKAGFHEWASAGWHAVSLPAEYGGAGIPAIIGTASMEMLTSACMALGTLPVLNQGAVEALSVHASPALKSLYLPRLVTGEWAATMDLTEPQAGSDLSTLRTTAMPSPDGTYRIAGRKIYITFGEHDLTDNIVHLVLARLPDAPPGSRGISLFLVPKRIPGPDGRPGSLNDITCVGMEHKLGIRASPTCTMALGERGGATGWLVGEPHQGLRCLFTMMNRTRLATGVQGVAIAERALQQALAYARERRQGRLPSGNEVVPIIEHPDVARNLMLMSAMTAATRALAYRAAAEIHRAAHGQDDATRVHAQRHADLLTPLVKAYATDSGVAVASLGIQIHGGAGYVEDTGAAQHWRDARIAPIYEGTNGIQSIDLVMRKIVRDEGAGVRALLAEMRRTGAALKAMVKQPFADMGRQLADAVTSAQHATDWLLAPGREADDRLAVATPYAELLATAFAGALLSKGALAAAGDGGESARNRRRILLAEFYLQTILPHVGALSQNVMSGGRAVREMHALWARG